MELFFFSFTWSS